MTKFKESGTWKDVTDSFIKVAGKWEKSNKSFIKVGGHWTDAANLPSTKLSYDGTTATDTDGTRYLVNSVEPTTHKAPLHSGEAVTLSGDGKIEVPINGNATLGADTYSSVGYTHPSFTKTTITNGYRLVCDGKGDINSNLVIHLTSPASDTAKEQVEFTTKVNSGSPIYTGYAHNGVVRKHVPLVDGAFSETMGIDASKVEMFIDGGTAWSIDITDISVKEITAVQGSVTVFDHATKTFTQPTLPLASTYILKDGTYGTIIKLHTNKFSSADLDAFTARPELVLEWSAGTATIPSAIVKGAKDVVYGSDGFAIPKPNSLIKNSLFDTDLSDWSAGRWIWKNGQAYYSTADTYSLLKQAVDVTTPCIMLIKHNVVKGGCSIGVIEPDGTVVHQPNVSGSGTRQIALPNGLKSIEFTRVHESEIYIDSVELFDGTQYLPITGTHTTINTSQFGIQQIKVGAGAMNGKDDGRFIQLPLVANGKHLLKTCTKLIAGDITNVTDTPC